MFKKISNILLKIISIVGIITLLAFVGQEQENTICKNLDIEVTNSNDYQFVDEDEVLKTFNEQNIRIIGAKIKNLDIPKIELILNTHPHIKNAEVFSEINGDVKIRILQRKPVVRIINVYDESFYIDEDGLLMPLSLNHSPRLLIANGLIFEKYNTFYKIDFSDSLSYSNVFKNSLLDDLFQIASYVDRDSLWQKQIQQIYVDKEIQLIPRIGNQQIILGEATNLENKFNKLRIFYTEAMPKIGWNTYSTINLKYSNQVVCTKALK
jgi:cell division protein FtsQ